MELNQELYNKIFNKALWETNQDELLASEVCSKVFANYKKELASN